MLAKNHSDEQNSINAQLNDSDNIEECPICAGNYSSQRKPMMPPCDHMICKVCVDKIVKDTGTNIFKCSICRLQYPVTQVSVNRMVL